jgi:hypothetical protein
MYSGKGLLTFRRSLLLYLKRKKVSQESNQQQALLLIVSYLLGMLFGPEDRGNTLIRNVGDFPRFIRRYMLDDRTLHNNHCGYILFLYLIFICKL